MKKGMGIKETNFRFPGQTGFYRGKVRDIYFFDQKLVLIVTDRISAFDVILPDPVPYKGQVLNQIAFEFLKTTEDIVPNWAESMPDPNVTIGKKCSPFQVEIIVRGYLSGHAWRLYNSGKRTICGNKLPERLRQNDPLPQPIITPTIKSTSGHDLDITFDEILAEKLLNRNQLEQIEHIAMQLYKRGAEIADKRSLILADTKYEFGLFNETITLIDEIHTPDSSRYFYKEGFEKRQHAGEKQKQLSKEFVREWLMEQGFQGDPGQQIPEMDAQQLESISERYIELYEKVTGKNFVKTDYKDKLVRIEQNINQALNS